jgi:hypothetical protein
MAGSATLGSPRISPRYVAAIKVGLLVQCGLVLAMATFESLRATLVVLAAVAAHWTAIVLIVIKRPERPNRWDLLVCRFGAAPLVAIAFGLAPLVWYVEGDFCLFERWRGKPLIVNEDTLIPLYVAAGIWLVLGPVLDIIRNEREIRRLKRERDKTKTRAPTALRRKSRSQ